MKKYLLLVVMLLMVAFVALGYSLFSRMNKVKMGEYYCDANEYGMMTSYAVYNILPDNKLEDNIAGAQGEWRDNPLKNTLTFRGDVSLESAVYNKATNSYTVTFAPDYAETYRSMQFILIDDRALQCYLAYPLGE